MAREWTTLDPAKSIWQGSPHDFVHTLTLQMAQAAPATLSMLLPMTAWAKAGMTAKALTYVGATQAGLSLGQISNNIQQEIAAAMTTPCASSPRRSPRCSTAVWTRSAAPATDPGSSATRR